MAKDVIQHPTDALGTCVLGFLLEGEDCNLILPVRLPDGGAERTFRSLQVPLQNASLNLGREE